MITNKILRGKNITLRQISIQDCSDNYVDWLNDPEVNQYLETKWSNWDLKAIRGFVASQRDSDHSILFSIFFNENERHIGNIKIGPIHEQYHHADISYFIGEKNLWGKGIATEAIHLVCEFGFIDLGLHRLEAGAYCEAVGSWKALERNGFRREAVFREQVIFEGKYIDVYRYGLLESEYQGNMNN